jgi:tRNA pseudouridine38-40 synthase
VPTYRIDLGYDGSGFHGYASQPRVRTVQGELEGALATVLGFGVDTVVAGRTDRGVHARSQVVSFTTPGPIDEERVRRSLATMLGPEVSVSAITPAPDDFNARLSATSRTYRYRVIDTVTADPMRRGYTWHFPGPLDVAAMNRAAAHLVGLHDFASFCRARGRVTKRRMHSAVWTRDGDEVVLEITASSFCHQMVRSIVLMCVDVGRNKLDPDQVPTILATQDRNATRGAAPPHGLVLWSVGYPG